MATANANARGSDRAGPRVAVKQGRKATATVGAAKRPVDGAKLGRQLAEAAGEGDVLRTAQLIHRGADVNYRNGDGETPLAFAAAWSQMPSLALLLSKKANPNVPDAAGGTALMLAAQHGTPEMVRLLLRHGADVDARDRAGHDALTHARWRAPGDQDTAEVRRMLQQASRATVA